MAAAEKAVADTPPPAPKPKEDEYACRKCGEINLLEDKFCCGCGTKYIDVNELTAENTSLKEKLKSVEDGAAVAPNRDEEEKLKVQVSELEEALKSVREGSKKVEAQNQELKESAKQLGASLKSAESKEAAASEKQKTLASECENLKEKLGKAQSEGGSAVSSLQAEVFFIFIF